MALIKSYIRHSQSQTLLQGDPILFLERLQRKLLSALTLSSKAKILKVHLIKKCPKQDLFQIWFKKKKINHKCLTIKAILTRPK